VPAQPRGGTLISEPGDLALRDAVEEWGLQNDPYLFFIDRQGRITYKHVGGLGWQTITAKLDEAQYGIVSAKEGQGDYRPVR